MSFGAYCLGIIHMIHDESIIQKGKFFFFLLHQIYSKGFGEKTHLDRGL